MYCKGCGTKLTRANTKLHVGVSFSTTKRLVEICINCGSTVREIGRVDIRN